tara:strand:+ start:315 stop:617 length:303 start_codon:yes stop_codon:yes gene_type:complete
MIKMILDDGNGVNKVIPIRDVSVSNETENELLYALGTLYYIAKDLGHLYVAGSIASAEDALLAEIRRAGKPVDEIWASNREDKLQRFLDGYQSGGNDEQN